MGGINATRRGLNANNAGMLRIVVLLLAAILPLRAASAEPLDARARQEVMDELQQKLLRHAYVHGTDFSKWSGYLREHGGAIERAETTASLASAVNAALREFGVSHVAMIPPEVAERMMKTATIGIGADTRPANGGLRVLGIHEGSGAKEAGLSPGDIITHVDGARVTDAEQLEGEAGSIARVRVRRVAGGEVAELEIPRRLTESRTPAVFRQVTPNTAMIRIPTFGNEYDTYEIEDHVERAFWSRNLILDLRGNGGGRIVYLLHLLSLLVPQQTVVGTMVTNEVSARYVEATGGDGSDVFAVARWYPDKITAPPNRMGPFPGRIAVLIDGGSASASEMAASALRELRGATIVGQKSAGALLGSSYLELPHGFRVQVPMMDYVTARGVRPEGEGIRPDIETPRGRRREDAGVEAALVALEGV